MSPARLFGAAIGALAAVLAGACISGPEYSRPDAVAVMPGSFAEAHPEWKPATPGDEIPRGAWWESFGDPELDALETRAAAANEDLHAAAARFEQARAAADVARAGLFPRIGAAVGAGRQHDSENRPLASSGEAAGSGFTYANHTIAFDLGYEVDLWGRIRRQVESATARQDAAAADVESVRLAIAAEVAAVYFTIRALDAEGAALDGSVESHRRSLELARHRRAGGLVSDLDVAQAETGLRAAEAQRIAIHRTRIRFVHALAVLIGEPAGAFDLAPAAFGQAPPAVPAALPASLLERRPDVAAAERRMAAANASIGVARAAYFPAIRLGSAAGMQSMGLAALFDAPSALWAVGGSVAQAVFDGGQRRARVQEADASWDEAVARYRGIVLRAFAEVEDALAAQRLLAEQIELEAAAGAAARRQVEIAENRYRAGLIGFLPVATAQIAALERERAVARLRGEQFVASIALIKALGGEWRGVTPQWPQLSATQ